MDLSIWIFVMKFYSEVKKQKMTFLLQLNAKNVDTLLLETQCLYNKNFVYVLRATVKPRLSNASVLDQIGFRTINSRFLRFRLRTKIRIMTKPKEAEQTRMRHDAGHVGFFHTIFGVTELLYFFYCLISNFCKFFQNFSYCTAS